MCYTNKKDCLRILRGGSKVKKIKLDKKEVNNLKKFMDSHNINEYSHKVDDFELKIFNPTKIDTDKHPPKSITFLLFVLVTYAILSMNNLILLNVFNEIDKWIIPFYIFVVWLVWMITDLVYSIFLKEVSVDYSKKSSKEDYSLTGRKVKSEELN